MTADGELRARMARPALGPVWEQLAERWANAGERRVASIDLGRLGEPSRVALADLLGLDRVPEPAGRLAVDLIEREFDVDERALRAAVAELVGPIADRAAARADDNARRQALWAWVEQACDDRGLGRWAAQLRAVGVPGGDADALRIELTTVFAALDDLPAGGTPLAVFAVRHWGDPHALDGGRRAATLLLGAVATRDNPRASSAGDRDAAETRRLWESVGVTPDDLSSTVLTLGLTVAEGRPGLAGHLARAAADHEPVVLTLDQLRRHPIEVDVADPVRVVENPAVVAEAARRRTAGVFICTSGWPSVAVMTVLAALSDAGCELLVHADFDADGLGIVGLVRDRFGATPWAMSAGDYLSGVAGSSVTSVGVDDKAMPGTPWDPDLRAEMVHHRRVVFEEQVIDDLLRPPGRPADD